MQAKQFVREATGLVREFGALDTLLLASAFVFALVFTITQFAWFYGNTLGANLTLALLVGAIPFVFLMLAYWVIGVIMPRTGNDYVWVGRVFHPSIGFTWSLLYMLVVFLTAFIGSGVAPMSFAVSTIFSVYGLLNNSASLANWGNFFGGALGTFELSVLFTIIVAIFAILGTKLIKGFMYVTWIFAIVGMALMWYILGTTSNAAFISHWNTLVATNSTSPYSYANVASTAVTKASFPGFSAGWGAIATAIPFAFLFLFGGNYANAFAGEIKNVKKSLPIALFLSLILGIIYWSVTSSLSINTIGHDWITQLGYGWLSGGSVPSTASYPLPYQPTQPLFLAVAAYPNTTLISIMFVTYIIGSLGPLFAYFWIATKYLFAWSFDRVIPSSFAKVSDRFHTPYFAIIISAAIATFLCYIFEELGYSTYFTMGTVVWGVSYIIPGLALMLFPWIKKDLFAQAPGWMGKKVASVPIVSLIGLATVIGFAYAGYLAFGNPAISSANQFSTILVGSLVVAGFLIYFASRAYYMGKGIDISMALKEIPPE